jgi:hypothetical protein
MDENKFEITDFGFIRGSMEVERLLCDKKIGVVIEIRTAKQKVQIKATPTGLIRVHNIKKADMKNKDK